MSNEFRPQAGSGQHEIGFPSPTAPLNAEILNKVMGVVPFKSVCSLYASKGKYTYIPRAVKYQSSKNGVNLPVSMRSGWRRGLLPLRYSRGRVDNVREFSLATRGTQDEVPTKEVPNLGNIRVLRGRRVGNDSFYYERTCSNDSSNKRECRRIRGSCNDYWTMTNLW